MDPLLAQRQAFHDAANWLTVLLGHVEAMAELEDSPERSRHHELARRAARAAHRLCAFAPGTAWQNTDLDPAGHARRLVNHLTPMAAHAGVRLEFEGAPAGRALADGPGFDDALLNLVRNAIEASPRESTVRVQVGPATDGFVPVVVEDEGAGMDPGRVPEPGVQAGTTKSGTDRGLGLSRVALWLAGGGATLDMEPRTGGGTRIGFRLPLAGPTPVPESTGGSRLQILLVEDDLAVTEVLTLLLRADGHRIEARADVAEAREAFASQKFDLVLCDQNLPDGSGLEFLEAVAAKGTPRFLVTGDPESLHSAAQAGGHGLLAKPVGRDDLRRVIQPLLSGHDSSPDPAPEQDA